MSLFKNQHPEIMMSATQVDCFVKIKTNFSILDLTKYNVEPDRTETRSSGLCFIYNK